MGTGKSAGSVVRIRYRAAGPPVEAAMATTSAGRSCPTAAGGGGGITGATARSRPWWRTTFTRDMAFTCRTSSRASSSKPGAIRLARLGMHGQGPHPHRLERYRQGAGIDAGDDEDRRGSLDHDALGGREAVEPGHVDVHRDDVGGQALHHLHRRQAVRGFAHDVDSASARRIPTRSRRDVEESSTTRTRIRFTGAGPPLRGGSCGRSRSSRCRRWLPLPGPARGPCRWRAT